MTWELAQQSNFDLSYEYYFYLMLMSFCFYFLLFYLTDLYVRHNVCLKAPKKPSLHKERSSILNNNEVNYISVRNFSKTFDDFVALNDFSQDFEKGKIYAILGPNGSGKTTFLRLISGQIAKDLGSIFIFGDELRSGELKIAMFEEENCLFPKMTVADHVSMLKKIDYNLDKDLKLNEVLSELGLDTKMNIKIDMLSKSHSSILALAMTLCSDAQLILLDEPTAELDPDVRVKVWKILKNLKRDKIIIVTTHHFDETEALADEIVFLSDGTKFDFSGKLTDLKKEMSAGFIVSIFFNYNEKFDRERCLSSQRRIMDKFKQFEFNMNIRSLTKECVVLKISSFKTERDGQFIKHLEQLQVEGQISNFKIDCRLLDEFFYKEKEKITESVSDVLNKSSFAADKPVKFRDIFGSHLKVRMQMIVSNLSSVLLFIFVCALIFYTSAFYMIIKLKLNQYESFKNFVYAKPTVFYTSEKYDEFNEIKQQKLDLGEITSTEELNVKMMDYEKSHQTKISCLYHYFSKQGNFKEIFIASKFSSPVFLAITEMKLVQAFLKENDNVNLELVEGYGSLEEHSKENFESASIYFYILCIALTFSVSLLTLKNFFDALNEKKVNL